MDLKDIYHYQKACIVVNEPPKACVAISQLANLEAQALYKKQPYGKILQHLRAQWVHYKKPSRPWFDKGTFFLRRLGCKLILPKTFFLWKFVYV